MAQDQFMYANGVNRLLADKTISWTDGNVKVALLTSDYEPAQDTDDFASDAFGALSANEIAETGSYVAGGKALTNVAVNDSVGTTPGYAVSVTADDVFWTGITDTFRYAVIYYDTGDLTSSPLLACIDITGADITASTQTFGINFSEDGVLEIVSTV